MATYYISPNGSNGNNGTSPTTPWATFDYAFTTMAGGDTLFLRGNAGVYAQRMGSAGVHPPSGSASVPTRIAAYSGETVIIQPGTGKDILTLNAYGQPADIAYIAYENLILDGTGMFQEAYLSVLIGDEYETGEKRVHHISFLNCTFRHGVPAPLPLGASQFGFSPGCLAECHDCTWTNCHFDDFPAGYCCYIAGGGNKWLGCIFENSYGYGFQLFRSGASFPYNTGVVFDGCIFRNCGAEANEWSAGALTLNDHNGIIVRNCLFYNNPNQCVEYSPFENLDGLRLVNNVFYGNAFSSTGNTIVFNGNVGSTNPTNSWIRNNIFYNNNGHASWNNHSPTGTVFSHNWEQANGNPLFVNPGTNDFHLQSGSGCRDTGVSLAGLVDTDFDGNARPVNGSWDRGAYEFGSAPGGGPTTWYVDGVAGNNNNVGNTLGAPFATIEKALSVMNAGDTCNIRGTTYNEYLNSSAFTIPSGSSWSATVRLQAYNNETVIIAGTGAGALALQDGSNKHHIEFIGLRFDINQAMADAVYIGTGCHNILFQDCHFRRSRDPGTGIWIATDVPDITLTRCTVTQNDIGISISGDTCIVEQCTIHDNFVLGAQYFYPTNSSGVLNNIFRRNRCYNNGTAGTTDEHGALFIQGTDNLQIQNCLFYNNYRGILIFSDSINTKVYNTVCYNNTQQGIRRYQIGGNPPASTAMTNTILYLNGTNLSDTVSPAITQQTNLIGTDPLFVNAGSGDFRITAGSPAANTGTDLSAVFTVDFDGQTRTGAWDIGAFNDISVARPTPAGIQWLIPTPRVRGNTTVISPTPARIEWRPRTPNAYTIGGTVQRAFPTPPRVIVSIPAPTLRRTTWYVATTGSDSNAGNRITAPFLTLGKAMSVAQAGDVIYLRTGTYAEVVTPSSMTIPSGTSWNIPLTIAAYQHEAVTITRVHLTDSTANAQYIVFDGLTFDPNASGNQAVYIGNGSHHIRIIRCECANGTGINNVGVGIQAHANANANEILSCYIHDFTTGILIASPSNLIYDNAVATCFNDGIRLFNSTATVSSNLVWRNVVYGAGRAAGTFYGLVIGSGNNNQAVNNILYNNTGAGLQVTNGAADSTLVYHNTITGNSAGGIRIESGVTNTDVRNNLVSSNTGTAITNNGTASTISPNYTGSSPGFWDAAGADYHLRYDSGARNAATTIALVTTDFDGIERPQEGSYDHGAYEFLFTAALPDMVRVLWGIPAPRVTNVGTVQTVQPTPAIIRYAPGEPRSLPRVIGQPARVIWGIPTPQAQMILALAQPAPALIQWRIPTSRATTGRGQRVLTAELAAKFAATYLQTDWLFEAESLGLKVSYTYQPDSTWTHQYASLGEVETAVTPGGGMANISDLQVTLYEDNTPRLINAIATRWQIGNTLASRIVTLSLLVAGEPAPYQIFQGTVYRMQHRDGMLEIIATDDSLRANAKIPPTLVTPEAYPDAAPTALARALPILFGDSSTVGHAPMLYVDTVTHKYAVALHTMLSMSTNYATLDQSTRTLQPRSGNVTVFPTQNPAIVQFEVGVQGLRFHLTPSTLIVQRELNVTNASNVFDGNPTTLASIRPATLVTSTGNGIGYLGLVASFGTIRGTNTLLVSATTHRRILNSDPTTTGQFIVRTIDASGNIVRDDLFRSQEFRHSLSPRDSTFTVTSLQLAEGERIETLIQAINEGGIATASNAYTVGELAMTLTHQPTGDEEIFLAPDWEGLVDRDGLITGDSGTRLTTPSDILGSLLIHKLGQTLDADSWRTARTYYLAHNWRFAGGIGAGWFVEQADARQILDQITKQAAAILSQNYRGQWSLVPLQSNTAPVADYTQTDILYRAEAQTPTAQRASSLQVTMWDLDNVHNNFEVRYGYNPATRSFNEVLFVKPSGTNFAGVRGQELLTLSVNSARRYGELPPLIIDGYMIYDRTTAENLMEHLVIWHWSQRLHVSIEVPLGRAAHLVLGDYCTLDHPSLPPNDRRQPYAIHALRYLPSQGRVRIGASRVFTVFFDYVALQDQSNVTWYFWVNSAGELARDTLPPSVPGLEAAALTPGVPPHWWPVEDETQSLWILYPTTLGELAIDRNAPGSGSGSSPQGAGPRLRGADGVTYRIGVRSWQVWVLDPQP